MRTIFGSPVLWLGVALFVIGAGVLLASTMYAWSQGDMNPNPVVAGMLAGFMFLLSFPLILIGLGLGIAEYRGIYVRLWVVVGWISLAAMVVAIARHVFGLF
jgi:hypothetical protein